MGWIIFILATIGWHIGMYGMFRKAGITPWKALVPFYNTWLIVEKCKIKKYWFWLQLIPIAGQFITIWITIIFTMHFGRFNVLHHTLVVFVPFLYFPYLGFSKKERWKGHEIFKLYRKPGSREWVDAIVFAVVAATIIRGFIFEAFVIPTGSMEKTLRINDFLFVNKMSYGPRVPMTPLSFPFVHNTLPGSETTPSYLKWIEIPYTRLPGFGEVKRNDVVVFNFPAGDTIINVRGYGSARTFYSVMQSLQFLRSEYFSEGLVSSDPEEFRQKGAQYSSREELYNILLNNNLLLIHPIDKTDNYIKRCVAVAGDSLQIINGQVKVNGQFIPHAIAAQTNYEVFTKGIPLPEDFLKNELNLWLQPGDNNEYIKITDSVSYLTMSEADAAKVKARPEVVNIKRVEEDGVLNPFGNATGFAIDNYKPIYIPKKDATITLTKDNIDVYRRVITVYEGHTLDESNGQFKIDGRQTNTYKFKYNYYWMMGDNRHNSQDSRFWGFVPETHIVGRASFVWFSWEGGPRWSRIFKSIK